MLIYNATDQEQHVVAFGNHFNLKAQQIKSFNDDIGDFLAKMRRDFGLVSLPEEFEDMEYRNSDEGKAKLAEYRRQGINNRVRYLETIKYNLLVSMKKDLDMAELKIDPKVYASAGEEAALQELLNLQYKKQDEQAEKIKRLTEIEKKLD